MDSYQPGDVQDLRQPPKRRHSRFGIASFVLACFSILSMFALFFMATGTSPWHAYGYPPVQRSSSEIKRVAALQEMAVVGFGALFLLSLALGMAGLMRANRKRIFAVLGVAISIFVLAIASAVIAIGSAVSGVR